MGRGGGGVRCCGRTGPHVSGSGDAKWRHTGRERRWRRQRRRWPRGSFELVAIGIAIDGGEAVLTGEGVGLGFGESRTLLGVNEDKIGGGP